MISNSSQHINLMQHCIDTAAISIFWISPNGRFDYVNHKAAEELGFSVEELLEMSVHDIDPNHTAQMRAERWELLKKKGELVFETRHKTQNGKIIYREVTSQYVHHGGKELELAFAGDITQRKQAALESSAREIELTALLKAAHCIFDGHSFESISRKIFDICRETLHADAGYVALLTNDNAHMKVLFLETGNQASSIQAEEPLPLRGLRQKAVTNRSAVYENDFSNSAFKSLLPKGHMAIHNVLFAPLIAQKKVIGVMGLANKPTPFSDQDARLSNAFAELTAVAFRNIRDEKALRESEEKFHLTFMTSPDAIVINRVSDGKCLEVNQAFTEITGYSAEEAMEQPMLNLDIWVTPEDRIKLVREVLRNGYVLNLESKFRTKKGQIRIGLVSARLLEMGQEDVILTITRDITGLRGAELKSDRMLLAVEHAAEAIVITDPRGMVQYVNPAFERITGYASDEIVGRNPRILKSGHHDASFYEKMWRTIKSGKTWQGKIINRHKAGSLFTEETTISPVLDGSGKIVNFVAVKRDITDEITLNKRLRQSQKMEAIGTLAGGIAHDFNNILSAIIGYTELTQTKIDPDHTVQADLAQVHRAGQRAKELVGQILAFSRQKEQEAVPLILHPIVKEALKLLRSSLPTTIAIKQKIFPCATVRANATQIHQILMNLCTNAFHAMDEKGGTLEVTLQDMDITPDMAALYPDLQPGPHVRLCISDTGCGMDPTLLDRIFEPYFTTKDVGRGTGMGLAVVHGIVKGYKGAITVESEPDVGTTFELFFPSEKIERASGKKEKVQLPTGNEKILLVDDEKIVMEQNQQRLEYLGYSVKAVNHPAEAFRLFQADPDRFDLVFTDMTMPQMTGDELAKKIMMLRPDMPIILYTGYSEKITRQAALKLGIRKYLEKPVPLEVLARSVREALDS